MSLFAASFKLCATDPREFLNYKKSDAYIMYTLAKIKFFPSVLACGRIVRVTGSCCCWEVAGVYFINLSWSVLFSPLLKV